MRLAAGSMNDLREYRIDYCKGMGVAPAAKRNSDMFGRRRNEESNMDLPRMHVVTAPLVVVRPCDIAAVGIELGPGQTRNMCKVDARSVLGQEVYTDHGEVVSCPAL